MGKFVRLQAPLPKVTKTSSLGDFGRRELKGPCAGFVSMVVKMGLGFRV